MFGQELVKLTVMDLVSLFMKCTLINALALGILVSNHKGSTFQPQIALNKRLSDKLS